MIELVPYLTFLLRKFRSQGCLTEQRLTDSDAVIFSVVMGQDLAVKCNCFSNSNYLMISCYLIIADTQHLVSSDYNDDKTEIVYYLVFLLRKNHQQRFFKRIAINLFGYDYFLILRENYRIYSHISQPQNLREVT